MTERRKRAIPPDERDFEVAREIDAQNASPMSVISKMDNSIVAKVMNQGMMRNRKRENKRRSITPMPNKFPMSVTRRQLPPPVEKSKGESDAEKRLKVLTKQLKNGEQERDELKQTVEKLKKSITELKNKPNEIQKLLDLFHYDNVEELQNEIIKYRVAKQKAKKRMIRYAERQS